MFFNMDVIFALYSHETLFFKDALNENCYKNRCKSHYKIFNA